MWLFQGIWRDLRKRGLHCQILAELGPGLGTAEGHRPSMQGG